MNPEKFLFSMPTKYASEPYRIFFPMGIAELLWGILLWLPQLWETDAYPVDLHRYLVLNGFMGSFIGGFLMTAVPRFSKTQTAKGVEVVIYFLLNIFGIIFAVKEQETAMHVVSALQVLTIFIFMIRRLFYRQQNPPPSFIFVFLGLGLWLASALLSLLNPKGDFKQLQYEGTMTLLILGVGGKLLPGILGHEAIVPNQERTTLKVPLYFTPIAMSFIGSYFLEESSGIWIRAIDVLLIAIFRWKLFKFPKEKTALTWCLWSCAWMIVLTFFLRAVFLDASIHMAHSFFLSGIVLLSLLIATRVLQSHGPNDKSLENKKILYVVSGLVVLAAATRVSAYYVYNSYQHHLAYSSLILAIALVVWSIRYLRYVADS